MCSHPGWVNTVSSAQLSPEAHQQPSSPSYSEGKALSNSVPKGRYLGINPGHADRVSVAIHHQPLGNESYQPTGKQQAGAWLHIRESKTAASTPKNHCFTCEAQVGVSH